MAKKDTKQALMAVLAPGAADSTAKRAGADAPSLPSLGERVDLFLRAIHGSRTANAQECASARLRIIDAMADHLAGGSNVAQRLSQASTAEPARATARAAASGLGINARFWHVLREALLWPLTITAGQPMRLATVSCATLLVVGGAWTATWFYAAHQTETVIANLIDQEAKAGRDYSCGSRSVGGYPFHVEIQCTALQAILAISDQSTLVVNANSLRGVASILDPGTLVMDIGGPVSVSRSTQAATLIGNWSRAQLALYGQPASISQVSLLLENPEFYSVTQGTDKPLLAGGRLELNATAAGPSLINIIAHATNITIPDGGPITSRPFMADVLAVMRGADVQAPQMLSAHLRDWQSRGGLLEVAQARIQQNDSFATGAGQLHLNDSGRIEGTLRVSAGGLYERLAQSYMRGGQSGAGEREQLAQSALGEPRVHTRSLDSARPEQSGGTAAPPSERKRQQVPLQGVVNLQVPIRIVDGAVLLGSSVLGKIPPLF
jgi:hypothetical protein